jgi:hypothetical protein
MSMLPDDPEDTMRDQYDFSEGVVGKYAKKFKAGTNVVLLEPDVAKEFSSSEEVNRALRVYIREKKQSGAA